MRLSELCSEKDVFGNKIRYIFFKKSFDYSKM